MTERITVTFPAEPVVEFAGQTVEGHIGQRTSNDEFPYVFVWLDGNRTLRRTIRKEWIAGNDPPPATNRRPWRRASKAG